MAGTAIPPHPPKPRGSADFAVVIPTRPSTRNSSRGSTSRTPTTARAISPDVARSLPLHSSTSAPMSRRSSSRQNPITPQALLDVKDEGEEATTSALPPPEADTAMHVESSSDDEEADVAAALRADVAQPTTDTTEPDALGTMAMDDDRAAPPAPLPSPPAPQPEQDSTPLAGFYTLFDQATVAAMALPTAVEETVDASSLDATTVGSSTSDQQSTSTGPSVSPPPPHIAQRPGRTYVQDEDFSYSHHPHEASTSSRPFSNLSFARVPPTNFVTASPFQEQAREALMEEDEAEVVVVSKAAVPAPVVVKASAAPKRKAKSSSAFTNAKRPKKDGKAKQVVEGYHPRASMSRTPVMQIVSKDARQYDEDDDQSTSPDVPLLEATMASARRRSVSLAMPIDEVEVTSSPRGKGKQRSRSRSISHVPEAELAVTGSSHTPVKYELQSAKCFSSRYKESTNCSACNRRLGGWVCLHQDRRSFPILPFNKLDLKHPRYLDSTEADDEPDYPTEYNQEYVPEHAENLRTTAASFLIPTLVKEIEHARRPGAVRRKWEAGFAVTCDTCLHSILCGSWVCAECGREACFDCREAFEAGQEPLQGPHRKRLETCVSKQTHSASNAHWKPFTRMDLTELEGLKIRMELWLEQHPTQQPRTFTEDEIKPFLAQDTRKVTDSEPSHPVLHLAARPSSSQEPKSSVYRIDSGNAPQPTPQPPPNPPAPSENEAVLVDDATCDQLFHSLWSKGEPIVWDINQEDLELDWSPRMFIEQYGQQVVEIVDHADEACLVKVAEFFDEFGKERPQGTGKRIKDWPPSATFATAFPDLYRDFQNILPMKDVTRLNGVSNFAAHLPRNSNPPDLGPKGYCAQASNDRPGEGQGSTKIHTVNLMLYSAPYPDGLPGAAAWDIFRAEDSAAIRDFLYEQEAKRLKLTVDEVRKTSDDPIHTLRFYLDADLRKAMWETKGVKPFRIWQRPGEVVFIPAGCAHQVCNFADCVKIASDFVSTENVERCQKVTAEFREQTREEKLWRNDVLQLKAQLLWAWRETEKLFPWES